MSDLEIDTTILTDQASKVDGAAADLESVSLTVPDLDRSTTEVTDAVNRLTRAATTTASSLRSCANGLRTTASSFAETDEDVAQGAHATTSGR